MPPSDDSYSPPEVLFTPTGQTPEVRTIMSAHEAGHATVGLSLGAVIEAVYARIHSRLPNGNFRVQHLTRFSSVGWPRLDTRAKVLIVAGGAAGEFLLNGKWDHAEVNVDRHVLRELGFSCFDYCAEQATALLVHNKRLLREVRDALTARMSDMRNCGLAKGGTHVVLLSNQEISRMFGELGRRIECPDFDLDKAVGSSVQRRTP